MLKLIHVKVFFYFLNVFYFYTLPQDQWGVLTLGKTTDHEELSISRRAVKYNKSVLSWHELGDKLFKAQDNKSSPLLARAQQSAVLWYWHSKVQSLFKRIVVPSVGLSEAKCPILGPSIKKFSHLAQVQQSHNLSKCLGAQSQQEGLVIYTIFPLKFLLEILKFKMQG